MSAIKRSAAPVLTQVLQRARQGEFGEVSREHAPKQAGCELADLKSLSVERVREFGSVYFALALLRRLGLAEVLEKLMGGGREEVAWSEVAAVHTDGKFCGQASELALAEEWYGRTALEELTGICPELINDDRLYRGLDQLVGASMSCGNTQVRVATFSGATHTERKLDTGSRWTGGTRSQTSRWSWRRTVSFLSQSKTF